MPSLLASCTDCVLCWVFKEISDGRLRSSQSLFSVYLSLSMQRSPCVCAVTKQVSQTIRSGQTDKLSPSPAELLGSYYFLRCPSVFLFLLSVLCVLLGCDAIFSFPVWSTMLRVRKIPVSVFTDWGHIPRSCQGVLGVGWSVFCFSLLSLRACRLFVVHLFFLFVQISTSIRYTWGQLIFVCCFVSMST